MSTRTPEQIRSSIEERKEAFRTMMREVLQDYKTAYESLKGGLDILAQFEFDERNELQAALVKNGSREEVELSKEQIIGRYQALLQLLPRPEMRDQ